MPSSQFSLSAVSQELQELTARAAASVVAIESDGHRTSGIHWRPGVIVTADERLASDDGITIMTASGERLAGTLAGRDPSTDIAVIRFEPTGTIPAEPGDASALKAGALVLAVGRHSDGPVASLGVAGFVGKPWRSLRGGSIDNYIRLDLSLARAAEGGAVVDAEGRVLGMAVLGPRGRALLIPRGTIDRVTDQLLAKGHISRGYLGASLQPVRIGASHGTAIGILINGIDAKGPAAAAGLLIGDIITTWADTPISGVRGILHALGPESIGNNIKLGVLRGGSKTELAVSIGERPRAST
ncbi:MAG: S1C family serine protease [Alphaproteobacteria bacterium]